jgi:hypothetical protein
MTHRRQSGSWDAIAYLLSTVVTVACRVLSRKWGWGLGRTAITDTSPKSYCYSLLLFLIRYLLSSLTFKVYIFSFAATQHSMTFTVYNVFLVCRRLHLRTRRAAHLLL